jgi:hypothetical protein
MEEGSSGGLVRSIFGTPAQSSPSQNVTRHNQLRYQPRNYTVKFGLLPSPASNSIEMTSLSHLGIPSWLHCLAILGASSQIF